MDLCRVAHGLLEDVEVEIRTLAGVEDDGLAADTEINALRKLGGGLQRNHNSPMAVSVNQVAIA